MLRIFFFLIVLTFALYSCKPQLASGMRSDGRGTFPKAELYPPRACSADTSFNATLKYKGEALEGILVKTSEGGRQRVIFNTYFGLTIFDLVFSKDSTIVNRCLEQMNKKAVLSLLDVDFRTLFLLNVEDNFKAKKYEAGSRITFNAKTQDGKVQYQVNSEEKKLEQIYKKGVIKRMKIDYSDKIEITHPVLDLTITLRK